MTLFYVAACFGALVQAASAAERVGAVGQAATQEAPHTPGTPPATCSGYVWVEDRDGCKSNETVYTAEDRAAWELQDTDYADDCSAFEYDYDTNYPEGMFTSVRARSRH
jgi:hypothetical protein